MYKMVCYCSELYCVAEGNSTGHCHAVAMRKYVLQYLLDVGQPTAHEWVRCDVIGCKEPRGRAVRWICCNVCRRWLHFVCADLKQEATRTVYLCRLPRSVRLMCGHNTTLH